MQVKSRWMNEMVAEAARTKIKMPFERGARRASIRARCLAEASKPAKATATA